MTSLPAIQVLNPDDYLQTDDGRYWTPERSKEAWNKCFKALQQAVSRVPPPIRVILVCGLQGGGKSTWISSQSDLYNVLYLDAALPAARHRRPIVDIAKAADVPIEAVWIHVPLEVALKRNALRSPDLRVPEASIQSVAKLFEPPSTDEGFKRVAVVHNT